MVSRREKENFLNQKASVFWLTGLSGSGKSTIAIQLERKLFNQGYFVQILDGDNVRDGICNNLEFSMEDRTENLRRVAELAKLYLNTGIITLCSFVSPTIEIRNTVRDIVGKDDFFEVFIQASLVSCESRDPKGIYKKVRRGEIKNFTGIDSIYEQPITPDLIVNTEENSIQESVERLYTFIEPLIQNK